MFINMSIYFSSCVKRLRVIRLIQINFKMTNTQSKQPLKKFNFKMSPKMTGFLGESFISNFNFLNFKGDNLTHLISLLKKKYEILYFYKLFVKMHNKRNFLHL